MIEDNELREVFKIASERQIVLLAAVTASQKFFLVAWAL